jgi:hypothetical protein
MVAAAIHASKKTLQAAHIVSRRRIQLHRALEHVRYHTWTHLKPAGTPCRCCAPPGSLAPGVHVRRSRRPVDGAKALRAVAQREGQRINGPARLESLKVYARRISSEATQQSARSQREYFTRLGVSDKHADALDAARGAAEAAAAAAEAREASDHLSVMERIAADHAVAAHRTAAIQAANSTRDLDAAAVASQNDRRRCASAEYFSAWVDQTVTGLIRASQRAAVKGYQLLQAANAARATAAPRLTTAERLVLLGRRKRRRQADAAADDAIQHALWERAHVHAMALLASRPDAAATVSRARDAARARRSTVVAMDPSLREARRAPSAEYTALQAFRARRQQDEDRRRAFARARRAAVLAARAQGAPRVRYVPPLEAPLEVYVRQVTLLLRGETPPRRARVRAAAAAAAASSGPIGTIGLL